MLKIWRKIFGNIPGTTFHLERTNPYTQSRGTSKKETFLRGEPHLPPKTRGLPQNSPKS